MIHCVAITAILACLSVPGAAGGEPRIAVLPDRVVLINRGHTCTVSRVTGVITFTTPYGLYRFTPHLPNEAGNGYREARGGKGAPEVVCDGALVQAALRFKADLGAQFQVTVQARADVPGIVVSSTITPAAYYFWGWTNKVRGCWIPGSTGPESVELTEASRGRYGYREWVYHPAGGGGLAIVTGGTVGDQGTPYLHALPRALGQVTFAVAGVKGPDDAAAFHAALVRSQVRGLEPWDGPVARPDADYGRSAPAWLREAENYNGFYYPEAKYQDEAHVRDWLARFPLIVGCPRDRKAVEMLHKHGVRGIVYVNFMEMYGSAWKHKVDEEVDISKHPSWVLIDEGGKQQRSLWGTANNIDGLYYTCFHQQDLHQTVVAFVQRLLEETGADGVFVDNAGPVHNCYGDRFGRHLHESGRSNTQMYELLLRKVYEAVKSMGEDKIVMLNSGIMPSHWAYSDAQMYESTDFGFKPFGTLDTWQDMQYMGELHQEAIRRGKVPVLITYLGRCPDERKLACALGTYAYCRLYSILWADWFELWSKPETTELARQIYGLRLGRPTSAICRAGNVLFRRFEQGLVAVNSGRDSASISIPVQEGAQYDDVGCERLLTARDGRLELTIEPQSGRVLVRK